MGSSDWFYEEQMFVIPPVTLHKHEGDLTPHWPDLWTYRQAGRQAGKQPETEAERGRESEEGNKRQEKKSERGRQKGNEREKRHR